MIRLNKEWGLKSDKYQWILYNIKPGKSKKGEDIEVKKETFHRNLDQVSRKIVQQSGVGCESLDGLILAYQKCSNDLAKTLKDNIGER